MKNIESAANMRAQGWRFARISSIPMILGSVSCIATAHAAQDAGANQTAATPASETAAAANNGKIGDIVVTARRVTERLQDIPASVSAINRKQIAQMSSLADIQSLVSGVTFKLFGPIPTIGIRGFGNRTVAGNATNSTVGIFEDGIYVSPPLVALINSVDIGRIEVAKGPQSTLYGRASFTGAINLVSNDPTPQLSGTIDAGYGGSSVHGEQLWHVRGAISLPVTDKLSVRVFGLREKRDGYTYDPVTHNRGLGYDRKIGRIRLKWQPDDVLTARLTGTIIRDNITQGPVHSGRTPAPEGAAILFGTPATASALMFGRTVWDAIYVQPQSGKTRGEQISLDLRFKTPFGELASLSDYQHSNQDLLTTLDLTRLNLARGDTLFDEKRGSEELRLSNKIGGLHYLAGLYFLESTDKQGGGNVVDLAHPFSSFGPGALLYTRGITALYQPIYTKTDAYAAFGQVGYDFTDKLNLTLGLRQSHEKLSGPTGTFLYTVTKVLIPSVPFTNRMGSFDATTGSANLSYKVAPGILTYASYARGNSPGGLNVGGAASRNYAPQTVDAYELGLKSQLFDRHLQLNVALFDNQYKDIQITQSVFINSALTPLVTNAGKGHGRGVDLDALAALSRNWRVALQYTYADSKITRYMVPPAPAPQIDFTGVPLVRSPRNSANGAITFTQDIGPGALQLTAEESYSSSYTNDYQGAAATATTPQVLALYRTPGYALTNLNASFTWKNWELSGYVRNLFNHQYIAAVAGFDAVTYPQETPGEPRTFEASLKYSF